MTQELTGASGSAGGRGRPVGKYEYMSPAEAPALYSLMAELIAQHHADDLSEARIAILMVHEVKPDRDGRVWWGRTKLVSERERQFHDHDFTIEVNAGAWNGLLTAAQRRALLDHELEHCARAEDEAGRSRYYIRKHDCEEFNCIVRRHGLWSEGLEALYAAAGRTQEPGLFPESPAAATPSPATPGVVATPTVSAKPERERNAKSSPKPAVSLPPVYGEETQWLLHDLGVVWHGHPEPGSGELSEAGMRGLLDDIDPIHGASEERRRAAEDALLRAGWIITGAIADEPPAPACDRKTASAGGW